MRVQKKSLIHENSGTKEKYLTQLKNINKSLLDFIKLKKMLSRSIMKSQQSMLKIKRKICTNLFF